MIGRAGLTGMRMKIRQKKQLSLVRTSSVGVAALLGIVSAAAATAEERERPNILLIASEDNSVHFMEHFHPGGAALPNIERLAENGITFDRTFSNAPVCSVARTTVITSAYAPRIATHHHRRMRTAILPPGWELFPSYLRENGYHTVKRGKKDFNVVEGDPWSRDGDGAHWRSRPDEETPFFMMRTIHVTHEGRLHFDEDSVRDNSTWHDPDQVDVFPYLPDTELTRYTHAFYLDRHLEMDAQVGGILGELESDGLSDSTIIIYYGDHGGVLPRSKGYLYEGGVHVPMVVYIPEKFQHLSPFEPGSRVDGFVEFVDFGPTVLNLAGIEIPAHMDGRPFLGPGITGEQVEERDETFSYADRFDEKCDMVRAVRKGDFKYIRNFWSHHPAGLVNGYRYQQLAYQEWRDLYVAGGLNEVQRAFFEARQPEELYDLVSDPHETRNLARDPEYAEVLEDMRGRLRLRMRGMPDLGMFPESYLLEHAVDEPLAFGQRNTTRVGELLKVADLALLPFDEARTGIVAALEADDPWKCFWALIACSRFGAEAGEMESRARTLSGDGFLPVRIAAAEFLGVLGTEDALPILYELARTATVQADAALALNAMTYLRDELGYELDPALLKLNPDLQRNQVARRLEYLQERSVR